MVQAFWETPAAREANQRDVILKQLEIEAIAKHVERQKPLWVLDAGCGSGETAIELADRFECNILAVDRSEQMIEAASNNAAGRSFKACLNFAMSDLLALEKLPPRWSYHYDLQGPVRERAVFDLAYSERSIINLPDWPTQKQAIKNIIGLLKPGGLYVMCEHSQEGLDGMNQQRGMLGLPPIERPWHNRYLYMMELRELADELRSNSVAVLEGIEYPTSTYYFLSRVVNAVIAAQDGKEPDYNSPINQIALKVPSMGSFGQGRVWLWHKLK